MLIQFTVENYLSFNEPVTFSMLASAADKQHLDHLQTYRFRKGKSLLPAASIYGANGSGKSNLVKAIRFAQHLILNGTRTGHSIPVSLFRLGSSDDKTSSFEFMFLYQDVEYSYGFKVSAERIVEEYLFGRQRRDEIRYFEREVSGDGKSIFRFGPGMGVKSTKSRTGQFLSFVADGTRPNQLFLSEAADRNVTALAPVLEWFRNVLLIIDAESQARDVERMVHTDADFNALLCSLLQTAGTGIAAIATREEPFDLDAAFPGAPAEVKNQLRADLQDTANNGAIIRTGNEGRQSIALRNGELVEIRMLPQHIAANGQLVSFELKDESDGTQRLIHLAPALITASRQPCVLIVDELDRRLHPLLSRLLISQTVASLATAGNSQLIFTTHDTNLLDLSLLRRDEIWFIEKDKAGASHLCSLVEYDIRPDLKVARGYLNGRFGAVPFTGSIPDLAWKAQSSKVADDAGVADGD